MTETQFMLETDTGAYDLTASIRIIGSDLLVAIWGGDKPHIGAVAVAQPRPSLKDPAVTSSSASVICLVGHKEDELAKATAEILAAALKTQVVVTAGIHWDNLSPEAIQRVVRNSEFLVDMILEKCIAQLPSFEK